MKPTWSTACPDWRERIKEGRSLVPFAPIFPEQAEIGLQVFRSLKVVDVVHPEGLVDEDGRPIAPTVADVCREWAMDIAAAIHGSYDVETGERLIREVLVKVPKKNWKSGLAASLMASLMVLNWRQSNEAGIIAPTKETADNVFRPLRDSIKADPELDALFHVQPNMRTVTHRVTGMSCRVYAADTETVSGKKWAFVIFEELWLLAQRAGAVDLMLEATGGQASRPEGVVISITTESDGEPVGVYKAKLEYAQQVRDGKIEAPHFLPVLYEWPEDLIKSKAYLEPENFHLVNPNYGASVDPADLLRKFEEAKAGDAATLRAFLAKRLNVPPSENMGGEWAAVQFWAPQSDPTLTIESLIARCEVICLGIDGGGLDDMLALSVLGRETDTGDWLEWGKAWINPVAIERRKKNASLYEGFAADGDLVIVDEMGQDIEELVAIVMQIEAAGLLHEIGVDQAGIEAIVTALVEAGIPIERILGISQGWKLVGAIKTTERRLAEGTMRHQGSRLMAWSVANCKPEPIGNAIKITKQVSGSAKIDRPMAMFNAVTLMSKNPESQKKRYSIIHV